MHVVELLADVGRRKAGMMIAVAPERAAELFAAGLAKFRAVAPEKPAQPQEAPPAVPPVQTQAVAPVKGKKRKKKDCGCRKKLTPERQAAFRKLRKPKPPRSK